MRRTIFLGLAALAVCGCKPAGRDQGSGVIPQADTPASPGEPASAPPSSLRTEFSTALDLSGTAPAWTLKIRRDILEFAQPNRLEILAVNSGPEMHGDVAAWEAPAAGNGGMLKVTLQPGRCSMGASGPAYPYLATVEAGGDRLTGCGAPAAQR